MISGGEVPECRLSRRPGTVYNFGGELFGYHSLSVPWLKPYLGFCSVHADRCHSIRLFCQMFENRKDFLSALSITVAVGPLLRGQLLPPNPLERGAAL